MIEPEFGNNQKRFRYAVIVCPKCRQHVQIAEIGKKTLSCQHCGALLQTRKLRVVHSSEELTDAVAFRTRLQAEISGGKGSETFLIKPSAEECRILKPEGEGTEKTFELSESRVSKNQPLKKDQKSILLEILEAADGEVRVEDLRQKALEKGMSPEKLHVILDKLLETGELYSPGPGIIKLI